MVAIQTEKPLQVWQFFLKQPTVLFGQFILSSTEEEANKAAIERLKQFPCSSIYIRPKPICSADLATVEEEGILPWLTDADRLRVYDLEADRMRKQIDSWNPILLDAKRKLIHHSRLPFFESIRKQREGRQHEQN